VKATILLDVRAANLLRCRTRPVKRREPVHDARAPGVSQWSRYLIALALAAVVGAVFAPAVSCGFVNWDDQEYVLDNPLVKGGLTPSGCWCAWTEVVFFNWAPLTVMSLQLDVTLGGLGPRMFHVTNIALHAATTALVFLALSAMTGSIARSAAATLLFALHPLRVESVVWIAERKDVLSMFFVAVALCLYARHARRPSPASLAAVAIAMIASLLAKAMAVTLPVLLLLLDVWPFGRSPLPGGGPASPSPDDSRPPTVVSWQRLILEKMPLFAISAVFAVVTIATQRPVLASDGDMPLIRVRIPNAITAIGAYLLETVLPVRLHPAHELPRPPSVPIAALMSAAAALAVLGIILWRVRRQAPAVTIGGLWFLVALSPVLGIVTQQGILSRADRFTYLPHIGLMIAVVWGGAEILARLKAPAWAGKVLALAAIAGCAVLTRGQIPIWRDPVRLWTRCIELDPAAALPHYGYAHALESEGNTNLAVAEYRRALAIDPSHADSLYNLGTLHIKRGEAAEAVPLLRDLVARVPNDPKIVNNYAAALARVGDLDEAIRQFRRALELNPAFTPSREGLARALRLKEKGPSGPSAGATEPATDR
jgi:hypothetical protein